MTEQRSDAYALRKSSVRRVLGVIAAIVVAVLLIAAADAAYRAANPIDTLASAINPSEYQAVFLTSGQVYFGTLTAPGGDFYELRHIYYLESQTSPQSGKAIGQRLVKLGKEIHGPEDLMVINRAQILFVENLKPTGTVSKAIRASQGG